MGKFGDDILRFALVAAKANENVMRATAIQLFSGIVKLSPVDTGRFRANWFVTGATPSVKTTSGTTFDGGKVAKDVGAIKDWSRFHLTNNLPYAEVLEFGGYPDPAQTGDKTVGGFSKQAPEGMVRVTIRQFNAIIEKNARKQK